MKTKIGDIVFLLNEEKIKTLDNQYTGSYDILDILAKGNSKIKIKGKPIVVHVNRLKILDINIHNWLTEYEFKLKIV